MWPNPQEIAVWSHLPKKSLMENFIFCAVGFSDSNRHWSHLPKKSLIENFIFCAVGFSDSNRQQRQTYSKLLASFVSKQNKLINQLFFCLIDTVWFAMYLNQVCTKFLWEYLERDTVSHDVKLKRISSFTRAAYLYLNRWIFVFKFWCKLVLLLVRLNWVQFWYCSKLFWDILVILEYLDNTFPAFLKIILAKVMLGNLAGNIL